MGVYDYWKGECPYCGGQIDTDENGNQYGDIQTKIFTHYPGNGDCFRVFKPGDTLPFALLSNAIVIGDSVCCGHPIVAILDGDKLVSYEQLPEHAGEEIPNLDKERRAEMYSKVERKLRERGLNVLFDV
jgi:hypothetical protein